MVFNWAVHIWLFMIPAEKFSLNSWWSGPWSLSLINCDTKSTQQFIFDSFKQVKHLQILSIMVPVVYLCFIMISSQIRSFLLILTRFIVTNISSNLVSIKLGSFVLDICFTVSEEYIYIYGILVPIQLRSLLLNLSCTRRWEKIYLYDEVIVK